MVSGERSILGEVSPPEERDSQDVRIFETNTRQLTGLTKSWQS